MPELPEIETIRRTIGPRVVGRTVAAVEVRCAALRRTMAPDFATELTARRIERARRRAKYLILDLDDGRAWISHFGMSGTLLHHEPGRAPQPAKHDHVVVRLSDGATAVFNDPRRFGFMTIEDAAGGPLLAGIGPEPLDDDAFTGAYLAGLRRRTRRTIKDVLMDQRVVAGLGNIYVNEILFVSGLRPRRRLSRLTLAQCDALAAATRQVLREAIAHRGSSISDFLDGIGRRGGYQWRRLVYDRAGEPCPRCAAEIKQVIVGQRSSFYCPACQI